MDTKLKIAKETYIKKLRELSNNGNNWYNYEKVKEVLEEVYPTWDLYICVADKGIGKTHSASNMYIPKQYLCEPELWDGYNCAWIRIQNKEIENMYIGIKKLIPPYLIYNQLSSTVYHDPEVGNKKGKKDLRNISIRMMFLSLYGYATNRSNWINNGKTRECFFDEFSQPYIRTTNSGIINLYKEFYKIMNNLRRANTVGKDRFRIVVFGNRDSTNNFILNKLDIDLDEVLCALSNGEDIYHHVLNNGKIIVDFYGSDFWYKTPKNTNIDDMDTLDYLSLSDVETFDFINNGFGENANLPIRNMKRFSNTIQDYPVMLIHYGKYKLAMFKTNIRYYMFNYAGDGEWKNEVVDAICEYKELKLVIPKPVFGKSISFSVMTDYNGESKIIEDEDYFLWQDKFGKRLRQHKLWFSSFLVYDIMIALLTSRSKLKGF